MQRDPAGYVDGMGLYEYCAAGPADISDPSGLQGKPYPGPPKDLGGEALPGEDAARKVLEELCDDGDCVGRCPDCTKDACKREAAAIARAYANMDKHYAGHEQSYGGAAGQPDVRHIRRGWMCYHWQELTYAAVHPVVEGGKCFKASRAMAFTHEGVGADGKLRKPLVLHNWVMVAVDKAVNKDKCSRSLDPWGKDGPVVSRNEAVWPQQDRVTCLGGDERPPVNVQDIKRGSTVRSPVYYIHVPQNGKQAMFWVGGGTQQW